MASLFALFEMQDRISSKIENLTKKTEKYAATSQKLAEVGSMAFVAIGAAALTAGMVVTNASDSLNKALNGVQASTGIADAEMGGLRDTMLSIYNNNFGENFQDIGKSLSTVSQITRASGKELENLTTNALMLRDTFEFEVNESTRAADALMKNFGITGDQAFTLIAQGAQNGANKNDDLLDTLNEYSVQFKMLGFNADQFTNVLINGAQNGAFSIDKIGDAVKEFTIRSKDGSKQSAEGFVAMGLDADQMTMAFAQGGPAAQQAFQTVVKALAGMEDPVAQNTAGVALFGSMFEDLGAKAVLALGDTSGIANSTADTLQKINSVKYKDFGSAITGIGRLLETGILVPLGDKLLPTLNEFGNWITTNMPAILSVVMTTFAWIGNEIEYMANNFDVYGPVFATVIAAIVIPAFISWAKAAWATAAGNIAAMAPLIGVALAVGAVVALLALAWKNNFLGIRDITATVVSFVTNMFNIATNYIMAVWGLVGPFVITGLQFMYNGFMTYFNLIWGIVSLVFSTIGNIINTALSFVLGMITGFFQILTGDFSGGAATIIQTVSNLVDNIQNIFSQLIAGAIQIGADFATGIINGFSGLIGGLVDAAKNAWSGVTGIFGGQQNANVSVGASPLIDGSHANGLAKVPFDGYIAELHKNEAVLTAEQAQQYRNPINGSSQIHGAAQNAFPHTTEVNVQDIPNNTQDITQNITQNLMTDTSQIQDVFQNIEQRLIPTDIPQVPDVTQNVSRNVIKDNAQDVPDVHHNIEQTLIPAAISELPNLTQSIFQDAIETNTQEIPNATQGVVQQLVPADFDQFPDMFQDIEQKLTPVDIGQIPDVFQNIVQQLIPVDAGQPELLSQDANTFERTAAAPLSPEKTQQLMSNPQPTSDGEGKGNQVSIGNLFGNMTINNQSDISKIVKQIEEYLTEQIHSSGEGVYDV